MTYFVCMMGGSSYACGDPFAETEECRTKKDVESICYAFWRDEGTLRTPCAQDVTFWVFKEKPQGMHDPYPDWVVTMGPRGGCKWSPA